MLTAKQALLQSSSLMVMYLGFFSLLLSTTLSAYTSLKTLCVQFGNTYVWEGRLQWWKGILHPPHQWSMRESIQWLSGDKMYKQLHPDVSPVSADIFWFWNWISHFVTVWINNIHSSILSPLILYSGSWESWSLGQLQYLRAKLGYNLNKLPVKLRAKTEKEITIHTDTYTYKQFQLT